MPEETVNEPAVVNADAEPTAQVAEPDYKTMAEKIESEKKTLEESYKSLQRKLNSLQAKADDSESLKSEVKTLKKYITVMYSDINKRIGNTSVNDFSEPVAQPNELEKLVQEDTKREAEKVKLQQEINDFMEALGEAGLDPTDQDLATEFAKLTPREALKKLPAFIGKRKTQEVENNLKQIKEQEKVTKKQEVLASGALAVGAQSSSTLDDSKRIYTRKELSDPDFVRDNLVKLTKAQEEGRIE